MLAVFVGLLALPLWILSLLLAQIEEKRPGSLKEWLAANDEKRLESFPSEWLEAFCKTNGLSVSGKREEVIGRVKEWLMQRKSSWDFFMSHKQTESGRDVALITRDLEKAGKRVWLDVNMGDCSTAAMMEGVEHSETFVLVLSDGYFDSTYCVMELRRAISLQKNVVVPQARRECRSHPAEKAIRSRIRKYRCQAVGGAHRERSQISKGCSRSPDRVRRSAQEGFHISAAAAQ
jgi:hypothetical protein